MTAIVRDGRRVRLDGFLHGSARAGRSALSAFTTLSAVTVTSKLVKVSVPPPDYAESARAALQDRASCLQPLH